LAAAVCWGVLATRILRPFLSPLGSDKGRGDGNDALRDHILYTPDVCKKKRQGVGFLSKIRILSEQVANQIAAGEVVERPASVVKELLENSIDAGATAISVEVEGGGTGLIRVLDDGEGMDGDDLLLALERHATSKLRDAAGLVAISTMGFRGEALPSIASVSRFVMVSRPRQASTGSRVEQRFGQLQGCHETGASKGTMVEVRDLFGNVPARRKFLKSRRTEMYHVEEVLRDQALAHPEIGFTLTVDGRVLWRLEAVHDPAGRLAAVLGYRGIVLPLSGEMTEPGEDFCDGWLLEPDAGGGAGRQLYLTVNRRPVRNYHLQRTVAEAMSGLLLQGRQPAGLLRLTLPAEVVDVNVHPAKREVRFRDLASVRSLVAAAVRRGLSWYQERQRGDLFVPVASRISPAQPELPDSERWTPEPRPLVTAPPVAAADWPAMTAEPPVVPVQPTPTPESEAGRLPTPAPPPARPATPSPLVPLAQLFDLYLLCSDGERLVVIDQHAAHERILYEQLREGHAGRRLASQQLLHPLPLELSPKELEVYEQHRDFLTELGFRLTPFGGETLLVQAVPALLGNEAPESLLRDLLESLRLAPLREGNLLPGPAFEELFARLACRAAIKSGARLSPREMLDLLARMEASSTFSHCPHGRPVARQFTRAEIEKWFHRS